MNAPDQLRAAAERLEERARDHDGQAAWHIQRGGHGTSWLMQAAEDRAVAALLRECQSLARIPDKELTQAEFDVLPAAVAVARVVVGDRQ